MSMLSVAVGRSRLAMHMFRFAIAFNFFVPACLAAFEMQTLRNGVVELCLEALDSIPGSLVGVRECTGSQLQKWYELTLRADSHDFNRLIRILRDNLVRSKANQGNCLLADMAREGVKLRVRPIGVDPLSLTVPLAGHALQRAHR